MGDARPGKRCISMLALLATSFLLTSKGQAEDRYYVLTPRSLEGLSGQLPNLHENHWRHWMRRQFVLARGVLDGEGEIYVQSPLVWGSAIRAEDLEVAIRVPHQKRITGKLYLPSSNYERLTEIGFVVPDKLETSSARRFAAIKESYYERLLSMELNGSAWFREQRDQSARQRGTEPPVNTAPVARWRRANGENTFALLTGGRAISENLQLDRELLLGADQKERVSTEGIPGITIKEFDWEALTKGIQPNLDPLAKFIPADQHVVFFPSLPTAQTVINEMAQNGTPLLRMTQTRTSDDKLFERYMRQLCLSLPELEKSIRTQGGEARTLAVTGSDPYFLMGTDVAVIVETNKPEAALAYFQAAHHAAKSRSNSVLAMEGKMLGHAYFAVTTPDNRIRSHVAIFDNAVVVTNSPVQLQRLLSVAQGKSPALVQLREYHFFRHRYPRATHGLPASGESAFAMLSDATIRRWCGPRWRIGASRRTRGAAILANAQAKAMDALARRTVVTSEVTNPFTFPEFGSLRLTDAGSVSAHQGDLYFQTPIAEMDLSRVTKAEADGYTRWRDGYQNNWAQTFDPIALQFVVEPRRLAMDLSVMPLIVRSEYRGFIDVTRGKKLGPHSGDPHPEALGQWVIAINRKANEIRQTDQFFMTNLDQLTVAPSTWMGDFIAIYFDEDPFWADLAKAKNAQDFMRENLDRLPVAIHLDIANTFQAGLFIAALRAKIDTTIGNIIRWETHIHADKQYSRLSLRQANPNDVSGRIGLYFLITQRSMVFSFNEAVIQRAIARANQRENINAAAKTHAATNKINDSKLEKTTRTNATWLGESMAAMVKENALATLRDVFAPDYQTLLQSRSWNNLHILNEWKQRYPDLDPVDLHERVWRTRVECPGGGRYIWNERWRTMESTLFGHPGEPKTGPKLPPALAGIKELSFGITFELDGLRARAEAFRQ